MLKFTQAATITNLVDIETVKAELGSSIEDTVLERFVASVTARIANMCNRKNFGIATARETFRCIKPCKPLWASHWPIIEIQSITEDGIVIDPSLYEVEDDRKIWRLDTAGNRISWCSLKTEVLYEGGYDLPDECPADLQQVCMSLIKAIWFASRRDPMIKIEDVPGIMRQEFWVGSTDPVLGDLPISDRSIIMNYTNIIVG